MSEPEELLGLARDLDTVVALSRQAEVTDPLDALRDAATKVGKSFSGSWLGYHSRVYYDGFEVPPAGAHFDSTGVDIHGSRGDWIEYQEDEVKSYIFQLANNSNLDKARTLAKKAKENFEAGKQQFFSILSSYDPQQADTFLAELILLRQAACRHWRNAGLGLVQQGQRLSVAARATASSCRNVAMLSGT